MKRLEGKVAVVTGATSGIGAATAKLMADEGARVILIGRNVERGKKVETLILKKKQNAEFIVCDVTSEQAVQELSIYIKNKYGKIDILFNNAGVFITSSLEDITEADWKKSFATNVDSVMYMTKYFIDMLREVRGNIVNNASVSGLQSWTSGTKNYIYGASKAATIKFTKLCALNYAKEVRVNCICPGIVDTEIFLNRDFSRFDGAIPMGYIAQPIEIAKAVLFLASDDAQYITGAVLPVDGGMALKS